MKTIDLRTRGAPRRLPAAWYCRLTRPVWLADGIAIGAVIAAVSLVTACGGGDDAAPDQPVTITVAGPNAVSTWNEIASATVNVPGAATGTPEEKLPNFAADLATVHVAIYDAVMAIVGTLTFNFQVTFPLLIKHTLHGNDGTFTLFYSVMSIGSLTGALMTATR